MVAGTTALLSVLLFSGEVSAVKLLVCQDTWRQYSYGVYRVCCTSIVCECVSQVTAGMQTRLCMHNACPKPNNGIIWKWKMEFNSDLYNRTALSMLLLFTVATGALP